MRVLRPAVLVLLFVLASAGPGALAAPARPVVRPVRQAAVAQESVFHQLQGFLVSLWSPAGCLIDPLGNQCARAAAAGVPQTAAANEGCMIDPLGRCLAQR